MNGTKCKQFTVAEFLSFNCNQSKHFYLICILNEIRLELSVEFFNLLLQCNFFFFLRSTDCVTEIHASFPLPPLFFCKKLQADKFSRVATYNVVIKWVALHYDSNVVISCTSGNFFLFFQNFKQLI